MEHRTPEALDALRKAEKEKKLKEEKDYINPELSTEAKNKVRALAKAER